MDVHDLPNYVQGKVGVNRTMDTEDMIGLEMTMKGIFA